MLVCAGPDAMSELHSMGQGRGLCNCMPCHAHYDMVVPARVCEHIMCLSVQIGIVCVRAIVLFCWSSDCAVAWDCCIGSP
jgi:hypothetical protein